MLNDTEIKQLIVDGALVGASDDAVGAISCDLTTKEFYTKPGSIFDSMNLMPGTSVFVSTEEVIKLPNDIAARIVLRNGRIRQGLLLSAPTYQPGHHTRIFFRLTNISDGAIMLKKGDSIAAIEFERLSSVVENPYSGTFQDEFDYKHMGAYESEYRRNMTDVENKLDDVKKIEKRMYSNVITLLTIFIGIFSLININVNLAMSNSATLVKLLTFNLSTVGSISFLVAIIQTAMTPDRKNKAIFWIVSALAFAFAFICIVVTK